MSNRRESSRSPGRGLLVILAATALSGGAGYVLQILVPLWLKEPAEYLRFTVFWATVFLFVSMISGLQQEIARATRPHAGDDKGVHTSKPGRTLSRVGQVMLIVILIVVAGFMLVGGRQIFGEAWLQLAGALALAVAGYIGVAILSGIFYGLGIFGFAALTTVVDSMLRVLAVLIPLAAGLGAIPAAYGVAVPFALTALLMWAVSRRSVHGTYQVEGNVRLLLRGGLLAMLAALATGVLVSGLPTVLSLTSAELGEKALAGVILALTLTRAPLVIPLLALQSYLVVTYRRHSEASLRKAVLFVGASLVLTAALAIAVGAWGPWALTTVYGADFALDGIHLALIMVSGGVTAALCVVAPALLAKGFHARFLLCWVIAAVGTILALLMTAQSLSLSIIAISIGPAVACVAGFIMLRGAPRDLSDG